MEFKNNGADVQVRIKDEFGYNWVSVRSGEIVDLPEEIGLANKFEKLEPKPKEKEPEKVEVKKPKKSKKK